MDLPELGLTRNLIKDTSQNSETKGVAYSSANPATPSNQPGDFGQPGGAAQIITAAVITSCFIQTSALPSRAELSGNDMTFFDDTTTQNGQVIGDTSRIVFTQDSGKFGNVISQGFILEKRASTINSYDNVISLYSYPAIKDRVTGEDTMNYMFFGEQGSFGDPQYNTNVIQFVVAHNTNPVTKTSQNGEFNIAGSTDGAEPLGVNISVEHNTLAGIPGEGFSVFISGSGTGIVEVVSPTLVNPSISGPLVFSGPAPAIAAGSGAGTGPTISIAGASGGAGGTISVKPGTTPGASATVVTVTYPVAFPTGTAVVLTPANAAAAALNGTTQVFVVGSTTNFVITSGTAALTNGTTYVWNYHVVGY